MPAAEAEHVDAGTAATPSKPPPHADAAAAHPDDAAPAAGPILEISEAAPEMAASPCASTSQPAAGHCLAATPSSAAPGSPLDMSTPEARLVVWVRRTIGLRVALPVRDCPKTLALTAVRQGHALMAEAEAARTNPSIDMTIDIDMTEQVGLSPRIVSRLSNFLSGCKLLIRVRLHVQGTDYQSESTACFDFLLPWRSVLCYCWHLSLTYETRDKTATPPSPPPWKTEYAPTHRPRAKRESGRDPEAGHPRIGGATNRVNRCLTTKRPAISGEHVQTAGRVEAS